MFAPFARHAILDHHAIIHLDPCGVHSCASLDTAAKFGATTVHEHVCACLFQLRVMHVPLPSPQPSSVAVSICLAHDHALLQLYDTVVLLSSTLVVRDDVGGAALLPCRPSDCVTLQACTMCHLPAIGLAIREFHGYSICLGPGSSSSGQHSRPDRSLHRLTCRGPKTFLELLSEVH